MGVRRAISPPGRWTITSRRAPVSESIRPPPSATGTKGRLAVAPVCVMGPE